MEDGGDCEQHAAHRSVRVVARQRTLIVQLVGASSARYTPFCARSHSSRPSGNKAEQRPNNPNDQPDNAA